MIAPAINLSTLPPEERPGAISIFRTLSSLQSAATEFRHTFELFMRVHQIKLAAPEDSPDTFKMVHWIGAAGRNGAIVAYGFSRGMEAINATKAPTLWGRAEMASRREATRLFATEFPEVAGIRKSAAHPIELSATDREAGKHRLEQGAGFANSSFGTGAFLQHAMHARNGALTYSGSFEGELASYELSASKADALEKVADLYAQTFS